MSFSHRPMIREPLFQIPAIATTTFLVMALLFSLFNWGRPPVAVAIALDLSGSTYGNNEAQFNQPGTVLYQEVQAVQNYLAENANPKRLRTPNQVYILGFAGNVKPLTQTFQANSEQAKVEFTSTLQNPGLPLELGSGTNLSGAIQTGTTALSNMQDRCRELLLVTDGEADVSPTAVAEAALRKVKINAIVVGNQAPALMMAAQTTGGSYISGEQSRLSELFTDKFFTQFNSNFHWIAFWLGLAWIAFMWWLLLPIDRWILQGLLKLPFNLSGRLAVGNALFWTAATLPLIWRITKGLPFLSSC